MRTSRKKIYLDYAASALPNPSSIHAEGMVVKKKLENARQITADLLGARKGEIIFTSGGTESNNLAIQGLIYATQTKDFFTALPANGLRHGQKNLPSAPLPHIVTTNIEHPSVLETCGILYERGLAEVSVVPVEPNGIVDPKKIKKEIKDNTVLVSIMYANNEIGTIQPLKEIAKEIRHYKKLNQRENIYFHTDAVQGINYLDLDVAKLGVDMLSLSGAKVEGGGRVGVLYKKSGVPLENVFGGGDQEFGFRPGTENWPEIEKFVQAFKQAQKIKEKESKRLIGLRNYFLKKLSKTFYFSGFPAEQRQPLKIESFAPFLVNGDLENRLPNNVNITFPRIPSDLLVIELSARGIMASSKSACKSSDSEGSYVIKALRSDADPEIGGLRFSFGRSTRREDAVYAIKALEEILVKLKKWY